MINADTTRDIKIPKASFGITLLIKTVIATIPAETKMALTGEWFEFSFLRNFGAFPCSAKPYSILELLYTQLL